MTTRCSLCWATAAAIVSSAFGCTDGEIGDPGAVNNTPVPPVAEPQPIPDLDKGSNVIRTVETRNPFGTVPNNLFYDGDFEFSAAPFDGQFGWLGFGLFGLQMETGGFCRTGMRCASVDSTTELIGRGASAKDGNATQMSIYTKPLEGQPCADTISAEVVTCSDLLGQAIAELTPADEPDEQGWCRFQAVIPPQGRGLCLYVSGKTKSLLDSGVSLPVGASAAVKKSAYRPSAKTVQRLKEISEEMRKRRALHHIQKPRVDIPEP